MYLSTPPIRHTIKSFLLLVVLTNLFPNITLAAYRFGDFTAHPPIHELTGKNAVEKGFAPDTVKAAYRLPSRGGKGTIAIITAYDAPHMRDDLALFSKKFSLPECTEKNGCFEKHAMNASTAPDPGWRMETALDVEWAHAIAPDAKILLVEAKTPSGANLLKAVDYARARSDVVAISMSWGGAEFSDEVTLDEHFTSDHGVTFFAASGDNGTGASWPAASPNVISVGGTHFTLDKNGNVKSETGWSGSGGGISAYEPEPVYQSDYNIPKAKGMRAIPDVAYNADPHSGYLIYVSDDGQGGGWHVVGGTSAGSPQWAAIRTVSSPFTNEQLYKDKASDTHNSYFRDIVSGKNGACVYFCSAHKHYDYVTGLGSPQTSMF